METLRKLSSMGRSSKESKENREAAKLAVQKAPSSGKPEEKLEEEIGNGGGGGDTTPKFSASQDEETLVGPSPPRARVTDDDGYDEADDEMDDGYDSAVDKMGTSSTPSLVEEPQKPTADVPLQNQDEEKGNANRSAGGEEGEDEGISRQSSIRAMPVAKLTNENDEPEEDVDVDEDEEEVDNEEEYEEANDLALGEEDEASSGTENVESSRIIARETADDQFDGADGNTSSAGKGDVPSRAEEEEIEKKVEDFPAEASRGEYEGAVNEEDNSNVVEMSVEGLGSDRQEHDDAVRFRQEEEEEAEEAELFEATSRLAAHTPVTGVVKKGIHPEVVPLETAEGEAEQAEITRGASSSFTEELKKSASQSLREQSSEEEKAKEESTGGSEPVSETESKLSASSSLKDELKKLTDARLEREASQGVKSAEGSSDGTSGEQKEGGSSAPEDRVLEQKAVDVGDGVSKESLDELKELTYGFHMQGRPENEAAEEEKDGTDSPTVAVSENVSPQGAEVKIMEEEGADPSAVKEELSKEGVDGPAAVPSPAKLHAALNAVDDKLPTAKSENGNVADTENVQATRRGFSFHTGDSDADEDDDDDDDEDDEDEDETDLDTAKALAELANAVGKSGNASEGGNKPSMGAAGPSLPSLPQRPAARKSAAATAVDTVGRITPRSVVAASNQLTTTSDENANGETAEGNETREKLQNIRVKFLRLAHRLGQSPQNVVVAQVLYRLGLAESLRGGSAPTRSGAFSFDRANALAEEQEAANHDEELDFACTILVLGKTGVGKSATINSIFDDRKSVTSAFKPSTHKVQEIAGTVHGIKVRVIDTPGLLPSVADQQHNERIMGQVKRHIKKASPDIVLYFDRLDMQSRDYGDLPLLRTITDLFGAAVWFNAIVVLTHASSAPPDGPNGVPLSYEMFVAQRSHVVQQTIRQAAGDMRLMNPVSLVENHPACRTNRNGQRVLPNGQIWKPQLLLLCFASKILAEANSLLKLQETATPGRPFGQRSRVPPLPFLLSSLLQSRAQLKLPDEQLGESDESDDEEEEDDSDADDYDELPPFRPLSKDELEELDKEQRQDYYEEIADRERLFQKKQYREEMRRRKEMKRRAAQMSKEDLAQPGDEGDDEAGKAAAVPVPMPDMALPPSFDSDNPTHRYRYLETANQWLVRPVLETHGWDHDAGYDGFNVEKMFVVKDKVPASVSGQVTKDKKEAQVNFEAAASLKHGEGKVTLTGFDIQTIGKDLAYTLRAETRFSNFKRNKTTAGLTCTMLNDTIAAGLKLEDRILIGKRVKMVVNGGVLTGKGDKAFGGSLEATLRGKEYPLSRTLSTLGLSVMDWHGDLAIGGNLQSQFMVGKTMLVGRANLNNRGSGQLSVRASSSEQLQMVLIGIVPILRSLINCRFGFGGQSSQ